VLELLAAVEKPTQRLAAFVANLVPACDIEGCNTFLALQPLKQRFAVLVVDANEGDEVLSVADI